MTSRTIPSLLRSFGGGIIACILVTLLFALASHGIGLRADDQVSSTDAPSLLIGVGAGLACAAPILPFTRNLRTDRTRILLACTLLISLLLTAAALICRAVSDQSGTAGTVWADLDSSPLAVLTVAALVWAAANLGFAVIGTTAAKPRSTLLSLGLLVIFVAIVAGSIAAGLAIESAPTGAAALCSLVGCTLTVLLLIAIRRWTTSPGHDPRDDGPPRRGHSQPTTAQSSVRSAGRPSRRSPRPSGRPTAPAGRPSAPVGLFSLGEIEFAHLTSLPPFDCDHLILTDKRIMRVRTAADGSVTQVSQAAPWQIRSIRCEDFRDRSTVTVELHVGSSMRLEETTPADARRFVAAGNDVTARSRA